MAKCIMCTSTTTTSKTTTFSGVVPAYPGTFSFLLAFAVLVAVTIMLVARVPWRIGPRCWGCLVAAAVPLLLLKVLEADPTTTPRRLLLFTQHAVGPRHRAPTISLGNRSSRRRGEMHRFAEAQEAMMMVLVEQRGLCAPFSARTDDTRVLNARICGASLAGAKLSPQLFSCLCSSTGASSRGWIFAVWHMQGRAPPVDPSREQLTGDALLLPAAACFQKI